MTDTPSEPIRGLWFINWGKRGINFTKEYQIVGGVPFIKRGSAKGSAK